MDELPWEAPSLKAPHPSELPPPAGRVWPHAPGKTYSVPRRFGIGTALFVTTLFGAFFGFMTWARAPLFLILFYSSFFICVSLAQMVLHRVPRVASMVAGALFLPASAGIAILARDGLEGIRWGWLVGGFWLGVIGIGVGYVGGTLLAGAFMIAENSVKVAQRLHRPGAGKRTISSE